MAIEVRCSHCGKSILVVDTMAGSYGKCLCGNPVYVPRPVDEAGEGGAEPAGAQATAEAGTATKLDPLDELLEEELSPDAAEKPAFDPWSRFSSGRKRRGVSFSLTVPKWSTASTMILGGVAAVVVIGLLFTALLIWADNPWFYVAAGTGSIGVLLLGYGLMSLVTAAFNEDLTTGFMFVAIPFYAVYFIFSRFEESWRPALALAVSAPLLYFSVAAIGPDLQLPFWNRVRLDGVSVDAPYDLNAVHAENVGLPTNKSRTEHYDRYQVTIDQTKVEVFLPANSSGPYPWVLLAPGGATFGRDAETEHVVVMPYIRQGFAVASFSIPGIVSAEDFSNAKLKQQVSPEMVRSLATYFNLNAGMNSARAVLDTLLEREPALDHERIFVAGHGTGGTTALVFAAHEPRLKGCVVYAPVIDLDKWLSPRMIANLDKALPGVANHIRRSGPLAHLRRIGCPVFLFHARDDLDTPCRRAESFVEQLRGVRGIANMEIVPTGGHVIAVRNLGIRMGAEWMARAAFGLKPIWPAGAVMKQAIANNLKVSPLPAGAEVFDTAAARFSSAVAEPIDWSVRPGNAPAMDVSDNVEPIDLKTTTQNLVKLFVKGRRVVARNKWGDPFNRPEATPDNWLDSFDLGDGRQLSHVVLSEESRLHDIDESGDRALLTRNNLAEVRSLDDGSISVAWPFSVNSTARTAFFAGADRIVTVAGDGRLIGWSLKDKGAVYAMDHVVHALPSGDGRYVIVLDSIASFRTGYVIDANSGQIRGLLQSPTGFDTNRPQRVAVSDDGARLACLCKSGLVVWDLDTKNGGNVLATAMNVSAGSLFFLGADYVFMDGILRDAQTARLLYRYVFPPNTRFWARGRKGGRTSVCLTAAATPSQPAYFVSMPVPDQAVADQLFRGVASSEFGTNVELYDLLGDVVENPQGTTARSKFGEELKMPSDAERYPEQFREAYAAYRRAVIANLLLEDDAVLIREVKQNPNLTNQDQPNIAMRWAIVVHFVGESKQPSFKGLTDLSDSTLGIGNRLYVGLTERRNNGAFGLWPRLGDSRFADIPIWGGLDRDEVVQRAQEQGVDALLYLYVSGIQQKVRGTLTVRIVDPFVEEGIANVWSTPSPFSGTQAQDLSAINRFVKSVLQQIDAKFTPGPIPTLDKEFLGKAVARVNSLMEGTRLERLKALVELRYYAARKVVKAENAVRYYNKILGNSAGQVFANGDKKDRYKLLEPLVTGAAE